MIINIKLVFGNMGLLGVLDNITVINTYKNSLINCSVPLIAVSDDTASFDCSSTRVMTSTAKTIYILPA